jgi:hypothetical protein
MWNLSWLNMQHWLLYNKLSSNNNNNNNHHVSVVQVCVSELTTCRALHFVQHLCCCSCSYRCWCQFCSLCWSAAACFTLTLFRQWSFLCCSVWTSCLYSNVSHWIRWELISCHTSMQFWFRVRVCWFLQLLTVKHMIWHSF